MGNSGWTADPNDITLPPGAGPNDPRIYIGPDDPNAAYYNNDSAIVFYFGPNRGFILSVSDQVYGVLSLFAFEGPDAYHILEAQFEPFILNKVALNIGGPDVTPVQPTNLVSGDPLYLGDYTEPSGSDPACDVLIYDQSMPRGLKAGAISTSTSAAIGTAETALLTTGSFTFRAGRAYEVTMHGGVVGAVANTSLAFRVHKTNAVGIDLGEFYRYPTPLSGTAYPAHDGGLIFTVGATDVTAPLCLTGASAAAGTAQHFATATSPRWVKAYDIGPASLYPTHAVLS